jgi:HEAT repeat protein
MRLPFRRTTKVADLKGRGDVAGLIEASGDLDSKTRNAAMAALAEIDPGEARLAVIESLGHSSERVRCAAVRLLFHWGDATPLAEAISWLPPGRPSRRLALTALAQLGQARCGLALARSLVYGSAQEGLSEDEVGLVWNLCQSAEAGDELYRVTDLLIDALTDERQAIAGRAEDFLLWLDRDAVPALIALTRSSPSPHRAVAILGQIGGASVLEPLIDAVEHPDARTREAACVGLGELGDPMSAEALLRATRDSQHDVRVKAAAALDRLGTAALLVSISTMATSQVEAPKGRLQLAGGQENGSAANGRSSSVSKSSSGSAHKRASRPLAKGSAGRGSSSAPKSSSGSANNGGSRPPAKGSAGRASSRRPGRRQTVAKAKRYKLAGDTAISVFRQGIPDPIRVVPGSHYTTEDPDEQAALESSGLVSEVKIPDREKR